MATALNTIDRFHNASPSMLADIIGELDRQSKAVEAELKSAKEAFKALGQPHAQGESFAVNVDRSIRATLDSAAVKALIGQQAYDDCSRLSEIVTLRISTALPVVAIAA